MPLAGSGLMKWKRTAMTNPPCRDGRRNNRPPVSGQFKPGQSGNNPGRPPGVRNKKAIVQAAFNAKVTFNQNGKRVRVTKYEAGLLQLANKFALGDSKAFTTGIGVLSQYGLLDQESTSFLAELSERDEPVLQDILKRIRSSGASLNDQGEGSTETSKPPEPDEEKS
jgi:hypothetical protein